jgi:prevent-host-death family protein
MRTITAGQLRARLGEALDRASTGERILIERDHRPIAALVPLEDVQQLEGDTEEAQQHKLEALEQLAALGRRMREELPPPDDGFEDSAAYLRWERDHR